MSLYSLTPSEREQYRHYSQLSLPRHTSYPISPMWSSSFQPELFRCSLIQSAENKTPYSLYVHIPFCEKLCYYCACTKEIIPQIKRDANDPSEVFLEGLQHEVAHFAHVLGDNKVHAVHLGGGSPTFLTIKQLQQLWTILNQSFSISDNADIAVEIDPRITSYEQLSLLRSLGFNRVSLGIQDFDPSVQKAVNRIQSFEDVERIVLWCRQLGYSSINFDLIYGLPFQTQETMASTFNKTIQLSPDRIAFYRLAVIPEIFRWQNTFTRHDLPSGDLSLDLNLLAINTLLAAGYHFIGLDHFARDDEKLTEAQQQGELCRNFQGMTTGKQLEILGLGPSAISQLEDCFAQNDKTTREWGSRVTSDFATIRGMKLSTEDRLRREVLQQLYGYGSIDKSKMEQQFSIKFNDYFSDEITRLKKLQEDGLVKMDEDSIRLTMTLGRLLMRVVAAVFDAYLPSNAFCEGLPANVASTVG